MQELYTLILNAPAFIQVLFMVLCIVGAYVLYRFRYIVGIVGAGAIALWLSAKSGLKKK